MNFRHRSRLNTLSRAARYFYFFSFVVVLTACGGGGGGSGTSADSSTDPGDSSETTSVTITWVAPSSRTDGSPLSLSQIARYEVNYGRSSGEYTDTITVNDATATEAVIPNLENGTYHIAVRVYDTNGLDSRFSEERTVVVN